MYINATIKLEKLSMAHAFLTTYLSFT